MTYSGDSISGSLTPTFFILSVVAQLLFHLKSMPIPALVWVYCGIYSAPWAQQSQVYQEDSESPAEWEKRPSQLRGISHSVQTATLRCEWHSSEPLAEEKLNKIRAKSLGQSPKSTIDGEMGAKELLALKGSDHVKTRYIA